MREEEEVVQSFLSVRLGCMRLEVRAQTQYTALASSPSVFIEMLSAIEPDILSVAVHPGNVKTALGKVIPKHMFDSTDPLTPHVFILFYVTLSVALPDDPALCRAFILWLLRERRM